MLCFACQHPGLLVSVLSARIAAKSSVRHIFRVMLQCTHGSNEQTRMLTGVHITT
jgi:hypothetical protein